MRLPYVAFFLAVLACGIAHVAILRSVIRRRAAAPDAGVPRPRLSIEVVWALIPVVVLALVFTATWPLVRAHAERNASPVLEVAR
jgi:heme/copper-type cytochrome/quinol oxidase subunit 2